MSNPTMLYRPGGIHQLHGGMFDTLIVDQDDSFAFSDALNAGWFRTTTEAKAFAEAPKPSVDFVTEKRRKEREKAPEPAAEIV